MEPVWRSKAAFWGLAAALFALAAVPSYVLVDAVKRYVRFFSGWDPGVLKATAVRRLPHSGPREGEAPDVQFVEFRLKAPQARKVGLGGDFNQWRPETLPLRKGTDGVWETLLPLPPGRYSYLYHVDGAWTPDPKAPQTGRFGDRPASLKEVR